MLKAIQTFGTSIIKDFSRPINFNKLSYGYFSNWMNNVPVVQNAPQNKLLTNTSSSRALLQADDTNLCLSRNVTKFSLKTGKKKSVNAVLHRFYRLNCGLWIRRRAGCHRKMHKKNMEERYISQQHVFVTKTQCIMLDKMITDHHKKRKYFIDDPFEPYQERRNFDWVLPIRRR